MARLFDDVQSEYLEIDQAPVSAYPLTMACWFRSDDDSISQTLLWTGDKDASNHYHQVTIDASNAVFANSRDAGANPFASTTTTYTVNTWHHACGVFAANNDRRAFLDGGGKGTDNTAATPVGLDRFSVARLGRSVPLAYASGRIAEAAIWNIALTDDEVAILAEGYSPLFVHPQNLVAYWSLIRDEDQDRVGGYDLTAFNTPSIAAHPPVLYPSAKHIWHGVTVTMLPPTPPVPPPDIARVFSGMASGYIILLKNLDGEIIAVFSGAGRGTSHMA